MVITIAVGSALVVDRWNDVPALWQFVGTASFVVLAYALADGLISRRTTRGGESAIESPGYPSPEPTEGQELEPLACPMGQSDCWAVATAKGLIEAATDVTAGLDVSQATTTLVHRACEMIGADAAWVYHNPASSRALTLVASHVQPQAIGRWEALTAQARRAAEMVMPSVLRYDLRGGQRVSGPVEVGEYLAVPLVHGQRLLGMLVVHHPVTATEADGPKTELLVSLSAQAAVILENGILHESHRDVQAKLRQLEHHRADYVSTLSHELRTPLTSIKGFAQLLARDPGVCGDGARAYAATIVSEADRLALIVNDIVDLTRMETGLLELHRRAVAFGPLVKAVGQRVQAMAPTRRVIVSLPERLPTVRIDPDRMEQLFERLLVEAVGQSSPSNPILLAVESGDDGVTVRLEYRTSEEQIEGLSEALKGFGQSGGDGQATQLGRGRLGLYICRNFIEAHDGKMWIEHPEEQLARVVFTLPY
ncbi:MAG: histidine kinase dimerization/phospho-acceptor domain-containing protein [Sphingomonadaceae bacterium]